MPAIITLVNGEKLYVRQDAAGVAGMANQRPVIPVDSAEGEVHVVVASIATIQDGERQAPFAAASWK